MVPNTPKLTIAQVCNRYYPDLGGLETHVREISERLCRKGLEVDVLTTDPSGQLPEHEIIGDVKIRRFRSWAPHGTYYFSRDMRRYLGENSKHYDVMHAHNYHAFPALYASQARGADTFVFTPHYHGRGHTLLQDLLHIPYKYIAKRIFRKADRVICVSHYEKTLLKARFGLEERKLNVIPNGIDLKEFEYLEKPKAENNLILCVARLESYKGIQYLVQVLPRLNDDIRLEIVGQGPYKETLARLSKKLGVAERVNIHHHLPRKELLQRFAKASVFVLLSKYEAYGISVAEALAARTPCIVANTSALREWIDHKNCFGIDYPIRIEELTGIIEKVMRKKIIEVRLPTWDEIADKTIAVYEDALNGRKCMKS